ncbi:hypothetical protein [Haliscomenobacter sp.]|uniref:hypothetical protein n=1 Tax=Haliscomenobacter sp. TaxID=2717303 RepID=UPI003593723D
MIVRYRADIFVQVFVQVAIAVVGHGVVYSRQIAIEATGRSIASGGQEIGAVPRMLISVAIGDAETASEYSFFVLRLVPFF